MSTLVGGRPMAHLAVAFTWTFATLALAQQQPATPPKPAPPEAAAVAQAAGTTATAADVGQRVWLDARAGKNAETLTALREASVGMTAPGAAALKSNVESLSRNIDKREQVRKTKSAEAEGKLLKSLEKNTHEGTSDAVKHALEMLLLATDRDAFKAEPRIVELVQRATKSAHEAEAAGDWFTANELFFRLNALMEEEGTYRPDVRRLGQRLTMIRLYTPERFWQLRDKERREAGKSALPPYNGLGENFREKLADVDRTMVMRAMIASARQQIDRKNLSELVVGGLESVKTLVTTTDLKSAFPGFDNPAGREALVAQLDAQTARISGVKEFGQGQLADMVDDLVDKAKTTLGLPENVVLHEFGNGAMSKLDDFSAIIWPDEVARFDRMTQGNFRGVGIQIQLDDETQMIKVVTPIEGTPAQRAGIRQGDLIKKINGQSAIGIGLNQAVDLITGPVDTKVTVTMERPRDSDGPDASAIPQEIDFNLVRAVIPLNTVKGWKRVGAREDEWDWFVDPDNRIGYIRLTQFTESTTSDLRGAIVQMQKQGKLGGLILDLRFNPGGLLTEAVSVANTFIDAGTIVSTKGPIVPGETKSAQAGNSLLKDTPVVVLINEGSASASEIVSGAIRHYSDKGDVTAALVGARSFGKGSVQNVWPLTQSGNAKMKLTTQYYYLPDAKLIHRKPGATTWGVDPHLKVEDLAETVSDAIKLRQDADVLPIDEHGKIVESKMPRPDPHKLLDDGLDLTLQHAVAVLQAKSLSRTEKEQASLPATPARTTQ